MAKASIISKYKSLPLAAKATLWAMVAGTLQKCVSLITTPIFTRLLTTEQYGQFTAYNSWMNIFVMFTSFNLAYAVFNKGMSKYPEDRDGYTSAMLGTTTLLTLFWLFVYLIFQNEINSLTELSTPITMLMFVEMLFYQAVTFWTLRQRYEFRYKSVVIVTLLNVILNAVIGVVAVILTTEKGISRIVFSAVINSLFGLVLYIVVFWRGKRFINWEYTKFAILFNLPLIPHYLSTYILDQADRVMIQKMCGLQFVGIYGVAYSIGMVMKIFAGAFNQAMTPWLYQSLEKKEYDGINKTTTPIMILFATGLLVFMAVVPETMRLLAGESYYEAIYIIPSVTSSIFFTLMYNWYSNVEFFFDANKFTMIMSCLGALANIVLNYIFIQIFGYVAAGYTTLVCYVIFAAGHFGFAQYIAKKKIGRVIFDWKPIIGISLSLITLTIFMTFTYKVVVIRYGFLAFVCLCLVVKRNAVKQYLNILLKK